jgi:cytochrome b561
MKTELTDTSANYGLISKLMHWTVTILVVALLIVGFTMTSLPKDFAYRSLFFLTHKSVGLIAFVLGPIVVLWALIRREEPKYPSTMSIWAIFIARIVKLSLMAIIIIMPWSGYIMASFFNLFNFPSFINATAANGGLAHVTHMFVAPIAAGLVIFHILAALKHHYIDRDNILKRMFF